jgi:predicted SprT family Zn-dependent metalloprotease
MQIQLPESLGKISLPEGTDYRHLFNIHQLAESLLVKHDLTNWSVNWDRSKRRAGECRHDPKVISLSAPLMALWTTEQCQDTILHEIAHALAGPTHGHDRAWKRICIRIGADPTRTWGHLGEVHAKGKYMGECPNGHVCYRDRKTKTMNTLQAGTCAKCNRRYDTRYRIIWRDSETGMPVIPPPKANR